MVGRGRVKMIEMQENGNTSKHLIESIWFMNENGDEKITVNYNKDGWRDEKLYYTSEYYGDHSENWVIHEKGGRELARHNTRFIASITWTDRLNH